MNKIELTSHDWWGGELDDKPHAQLTADDLAVLDRLAELTLHVDARFHEMRRFHAELPHGQSVQARLRSLMGPDAVCAVADPGPITRSE